MGWHSITITPSSDGDAVAADLLRRANDPTTWSLESLGAIIFRQRLGDADRFFFCPKASAVHGQLISTRDGQPCDSPLLRTLLPASSSRLALGFQTKWEPVKRPDRKQISRHELR